MTYNYSNMSMLEVAEHLMLRKKTPQSFKKIAQEVSELLGLSEDDLNRRLGQFYADLTLSGEFVNVGGDKWDLKNRQKFEAGDYQFIFDETEEKKKSKKKGYSDGDDTDEEEQEDLDEEEVEDEYEEDYDDGEDKV